MQGFVLELARLEEVALSAYCENARQLGYTFVTLETLVDETERVYWLHQECRKRQPPLGTHQEPQDYALWLRTWAVPEAHPELYHVLRKHEEYIGVCGLVKTETAEEFICGFTGILPGYSRTGLTLALKSHLLLAAKQRGVVCIKTSVHPDNTGMLRLNQKLSFAQMP